MQLPHIDPLFLALTAVSTAIMILLPIVVAVVLVRRLKTPPWVVFAGAAVFIVFQGILRIPWVLLLGPKLAPVLKGNVLASVAYAGFLALTAGIFEEVGRYVGYRVFFRKLAPNWARAVVFGAGHGGVEALGLGLVSLSSLINMLVLPSVFSKLPESTQHTVVQQYQALASLPVWSPLVAPYERVGAITFHIALSVVVYQAIRRRQIGWLFLAIGLHTLLDFMAVAVTLIPGLDATMKIILPEAGVTLFALLGVWIIFRLRDPAGAKDVTKPVAATA